MVTKIHPTALVHSGAQLGQNVVIGPFCLVESGAVIGDDCQLEARATIKSRTTIGCDNSIGEAAVLGGAAQDLEGQEPGGTLTIGDHNRIRENVTIHRGLEEGATTVVKDHNLLMVSSHVGHDCLVGSHCILVNHVLLGGHAQVDDRAYLGGSSSVDAHCRIGRLAMLGAMALITQDVPPYVTVVGSQVVGLNKVGLKRSGVTPADMRRLKEAYQVIYRQGLRWSEVLAILESDFQSGPAAEFTSFLKSGKRGFAQERRVPRSMTLKLADHAEPQPVEADDQESGQVRPERVPLAARAAIAGP